MRRVAIVNGDDFGLSPGINRGIVEAYQKGILTSASLMATGEAFEEAVVLVRENPGLSVGVHLTLVEGAPLIPSEKIPSLVTSDGRFFRSLGAFLARWLTGRIRREEIERELTAQVGKVLDHGIRIDKLDSHMHLHLLPGIFTIVLALAKRHRITGIRVPNERLPGWDDIPRILNGVKLVSLAVLSSSQRQRVKRAGLSCSDGFAGLAQSGGLTEEALARILGHLQSGVTEVMVHPGHRDAVLDRWPQSRRYDREQELKALTSPQVRSLVEKLGITLISYREVCQRV